MESKRVRPSQAQTLVDLASIPVPVIRYGHSVQIISSNTAAQNLHPGLRETKNFGNLATATDSFGLEVGWDEVRERLQKSRRPISVVAHIKRRKSAQPVLCNVSLSSQDVVQVLFVPQVAELDRIANRILRTYLTQRRKDELFAVITSEVHKIACADRTFLKIYDPRTNLLTHKAHVPSGVHGSLPQPCRPEEGGIPGWVFLNNAAYYSPRLREESGSLSQTRYPDTESRLAVPITFPSSEEVYGVLVVDATKEDRFTDETFWACTIVARYAAFALAEARSTDHLRSQYDRTLADMQQGYDGKLVGSILHDGKRIVGNVVDALEGMEDELSKKSFGKGTARKIATKLQQLRHVSGLMEVMLHKLKSREGGDRTDVSPVDLRLVAERVVSVLSLSEGEFVDISLDAGERDFPIRAREYHLVASIYNLANNAIAAIKNSGRKGNVVVRLEDTPKKPGSYRIIVEDDGPGMSASQLRLTRAGTSFSGIPGGFGFGLNTVYSIVKNELGGSIFVDSKFGATTRFIIDVPKG
jgi:nitrogen-specific signal transduction histidine kinase